MKIGSWRLGILCMLLTGLAINSTAQQNVMDKKITVTFVLSSPDLADSTSVFIAGSHQELGYWNPEAIQMQSSGNNTWIKKITVNAPISLEYKFTLGSWGRQGSDANGNEYSNFDVSIKNDTTIHHSIYFWTKAQRERVIESKVTGTVAYHKQVNGEGIPPRDIVVWLPPDYSTSSKRYPVVYMHDGQNIFDPATSSFGVDWKIDETSDSLIRKGITISFIVVGIYNTANRTEEYTPGEKGKVYMNFVVNKVKPLIDSTYRTLPDRKNTIVGGSSAGGIISFMLVWEYSNVFSKAICMSPAFKIQEIDYVKTVLGSSKRKKVFFYIDNGGIGIESQLQPGINEMIVALKQKGYKEEKDYFYHVDPKAKHFESEWAKRFPEAIKICLSK